MRLSTTALVCVVGLALIAFGCGSREDADRTDASHSSGEAPQPDDGSAQAADVAAASSDDWCAAHEVPESKCTKCNPSLVAAYQAKGDWCAEHGLPESVCPICNPKLRRAGGTAAAADDEPPPDRLKIRLGSAETSRVVGIATERGRATEGPQSLVVPVRLAYDAAHRAEINARSAGVVVAVMVDLGSQVRKGTPLLIVDSPEVGADRSRLIAARASVDAASAQLERERALFAEGITTRRSVQEAESSHAAARAEVLALEAAAAMVGEGGNDGRYTLHAPLAGVVVRRAATVGRRVDPEEVLLEIADASLLWAELDIPEARLSEVRVGHEVDLSFDSQVGRTFSGTIDSIAPEVDPQTRTARARVRVANRDGALRANMYGRARIVTARQGSGVEVPISALQQANGAAIVFVRLTDALYETRRVETGARSAGWVELTRGVAPGEDVVTVGSFLLMTETLKGSIGAGCCGND